jgi:hypothetical protein
MQDVSNFALTEKHAMTLAVKLGKQFSTFFFLHFYRLEILFLLKAFTNIRKFYA